MMKERDQCLCGLQRGGGGGVIGSRPTRCGQLLTRRVSIFNFFIPNIQTSGVFFISCSHFKVNKSGSLRNE